MVLPPAIDKQNEGVEPNCARPGAVMLQQVERGSAVFIQRNNLPVNDSVFGKCRTCSDNAREVSI